MCNSTHMYVGLMAAVESLGSTINYVTHMRNTTHMYEELLAGGETLCSTINSISFYWLLLFVPVFILLLIPRTREMFIKVDDFVYKYSWIVRVVIEFIQDTMTWTLVLGMGIILLVSYTSACTERERPVCSDIASAMKTTHAVSEPIVIGVFYELTMHILPFMYQYMTCFRWFGNDPPKEVCINHIVHTVELTSHRVTPDYKPLVVPYLCQRWMRYELTGADLKTIEATMGTLESIPPLRWDNGTSSREFLQTLISKIFTVDLIKQASHGDMKRVVSILLESK